MSDTPQPLIVSYRPIQDERERAAFEAALDTLIYLALKCIEANREYYEAAKRSYREIPCAYSKDSTGADESVC